MISPSLSHILIPLIVGSSILLMLVRPRGIAEVRWIGGGVLLLMALQLVSLPVVGKAIAKGTDVYLFLIGMMLVSELAREQGVFDWLASLAVKGTHGSSSRLFTLIYGIGTLVTIFMSNDATAVVLTPAILAAVRKAKVQPLPYLFTCALIANAASFVLPISNPANLVVFRAQMPSLARWLAWFAVPCLVSIVTTFAVLRFVFRRQLADEIDVKVEEPELGSGGKVVLGGLVAMIAVLLAASALGSDLGLPTCLAALAVTVSVSFRVRKSPAPLFREISWETLLLVAGLFVMVDAMEGEGALQVTQHWLAAAQQLAPSIGALLVGFVVAVGNNVVNNLPLGLIAGATLQAAHAKDLLAQAVLIGVDLGPNLSVTGSLATILWLLALRREGLNVSFGKFLKLGVVAMPLALLAALGTAIVVQAMRPHP